MCESVGILFFISLIAGSSLACDTSSINQCEQTFMNALGLSGSMSLQNMIVPNSSQSAEYFDLMRTSSQTLKRCIDPLVSKCPVDNERLRELYDINDIYAYICKTGRADIVRYSDCLNTKNVRNGTRQCLKRYTANQHSTQALCANLNNTLTCMGDAVDNNCGVKSASVYTYIMSYSLLRGAPNGSCKKVRQSFRPVGTNGGVPPNASSNNPYEEGGVPPNASSNKPMNSAYVICIAMIFLLSLKKIN